MSDEFITAATQGNVLKVKEMLQVDPKLARVKDDNGLSVILKTTYYGKKDVVAELLATGVELDIFEASATGQTERVSELTKKEPGLVNNYSSDGFTPLGLAVFFDHPEVVDVLLSAGANVNLASQETMKVTPLASAAAAKRTGIARVLIVHGADVNARAETDFTPLHEVAATGNLEFAMLLLDNGADINATTKDGKTPLSYAMEHNRLEMVELLRKRGRK